VAHIAQQNRAHFCPGNFSEGDSPNPRIVAAADDDLYECSRAVAATASASINSPSVTPAVTDWLKPFAD
jgi:hypothetical protein